jgi:hypothetical protein
MLLRKCRSIPRIRIENRPCGSQSVNYGNNAANPNGLCEMFVHLARNYGELREQWRPLFLLFKVVHREWNKHVIDTAWFRAKVPVVHHFPPNARSCGIKHNLLLSPLLICAMRKLVAS